MAPRVWRKAGRRATRRQHQAFSLTELMVVILILTLLAGLVLPATAHRYRGKSKRMACAGSLKLIGLAFRVYEADQVQSRPAPALGTEAITNITDPWTLIGGTYLQLSNHLWRPQLLVCPADNRLPAKDFHHLVRQNVSYFRSVDARPDSPWMLLAGDRNLTTNGVAVPPGWLDLTSNLIVGFTKELHNSRGNVALGDGSVHSLPPERSREASNAAGREAFKPTQVKRNRGGFHPFAIEFPLQTGSPTNRLAVP